MTGTQTDRGTLEIAEQSFDLDFCEQNIVPITDRRGNTLKYQLFEGVLYSPFFKHSCLKQIRNFTMRPDDIYFTGYPRTGTHWTFEMASMLLNGKAETIQRFKDHNELVSAEELEKLPSPRIINSHMKLSDSPNEVRSKRVKVIYTLRDPKDVAVSLYTVYYGRPLPGGTYKGSFEDFLQLFLEGTIDNNGIFEHLRDTETYFNDNPDIPVHFQRYEETLKDPVQAVKKLSDFLGVPKNDDLCRAIAEKCEFIQMKADKDKFSIKLDGENFLYRKGIVGDWRNYFTDEMLEEYDRVYDEVMSGSRFYGLYAKDKL